MDKQTPTQDDKIGHDPRKIAGKMIRAERMRRGLTRADMAKITHQGIYGLSEMTIGRVEKGTTEPTEATILGIAAGLGMDARIIDKIFHPELQPRAPGVLVVTFEVPFETPADIEAYYAMKRDISNRYGVDLSNEQGRKTQSIEVTFIVSPEDAIKIATALANGDLDRYPIKSIGFPSYRTIRDQEDSERSHSPKSNRGTKPRIPKPES